MKRTWPPPQVIFVGLELNQHGQAASQEQASSSCPVIFHGVLSFGSSVALTVEAEYNSAAASAPNGERKSDVVFMVQDSTTTRASDNPNFVPSGGLGFVLGTAGDEARTRDVLLGKEVLYH